jgi:hypothetical protein
MKKILIAITALLLIIGCCTTTHLDWRYAIWRSTRASNKQIREYKDSLCEKMRNDLLLGTWKYECDPCPQKMFHPLSPVTLSLYCDGAFDRLTYYGGNFFYGSIVWHDSGTWTNTGKMNVTLFGCRNPGLNVVDLSVCTNVFLLRYKQLEGGTQPLVGCDGKPAPQP